MEKNGREWETKHEPTPFQAQLNKRTAQSSRREQSSTACTAMFDAEYEARLSPTKRSPLKQDKKTSPTKEIYSDR